MCSLPPSYFRPKREQSDGNPIRILIHLKKSGEIHLRLSKCVSGPLINCRYASRSYPLCQKTRSGKCCVSYGMWYKYKRPRNKSLVWVRFAQKSTPRVCNAYSKLWFVQLTDSIQSEVIGYKSPNSVKI